MSKYLEFAAEEAWRRDIQEQTDYGLVLGCLEAIGPGRNRLDLPNYTAENGGIFIPVTSSIHVGEFTTRLSLEQNNLHVTYQLGETVYGRAAYIGHWPETEEAKLYHLEAEVNDWSQTHPLPFAPAAREALKASGTHIELSANDPAVISEAIFLRRASPDGPGTALRYDLRKESGVDFQKAPGYPEGRAERPGTIRVYGNVNVSPPEGAYTCIGVGSVLTTVGGPTSVPVHVTEPLEHPVGSYPYGTPPVIHPPNEVAADRRQYRLDTEADTPAFHRAVAKAAEWQDITDAFIDQYHEQLTSQADSVDISTLMRTMRVLFESQVKNSASLEPETVRPREIVRWLAANFR